MTETLKPKARGLGRGLNALFEDDESDFMVTATSGNANGQSSQSRAPVKLGIDQLSPGKGQPRRNFKEASLEELAASIRQHGVLQPLLVREHEGREGQYEIIAGERRWRAAQKAQLHEVPVVILSITDIQAFEIALIENLQREDLDPIDEAYGFQKLMNEYAYTQEKLAESLGKSRSHIANMLRLLQLPFAVQSQLSDGILTVGHARALIPAGDKAETLAKDIAARGLSVRETERLVADALGRGAQSGPGDIKFGNDIDKSERSKFANTKDADLLAFERQLTNMLGMKVTIDDRNAGKGVLKVEYLSLDQLDDIVLRLSRMPDLRKTKYADPDYQYSGEDD